MTENTTPMTEAQEQAQAALSKVMNSKFSNFDAGAVIHWAERGLYRVVTGPSPEQRMTALDDRLYMLAENWKGRTDTAVGDEIRRRCASELLKELSRDVEPSPQPHVMGNEEILEWLETEVSAIDTWYRGSPTYEHEAGWMKDEVLRLLEFARKAFSAPNAAGDDVEPRSRMQLSSGYLNSFEVVISALKSGGKQAQDAGHVAHGACLLHAAVELEAVFAERAEPKQYLIGDRMIEMVFKPSGMTDVSNLQAVFDAVEVALTLPPKSNFHVSYAAGAYVDEQGIQYSGGIVERAFEAGALWAMKVDRTPSVQPNVVGPIAYIAPDIFELLKAGGSGMFPISNSEFKNSDLTVPLYAELPEFNGEETPEGGVIRLSKWPEGYVLWYHGEIVWRSWINVPRELTLRLSLDTTLLREALTQTQEQEAPDRVCQDADGCPTEMAVLKRFWREHQNPSVQPRARGA